MAEPVIRIVIADDSAEMRRNLRMLLALETDMEITAMARDGAEAIELCAHHQPDVAVVDLDMPRVNGLAAIRTIREKSPGTACIVVSAQDERGFIQQAMASGARQYFVKPADPDGLIASIRELSREAREQKRALAASRQAETQRQQVLVKLAEAYARKRRADDDALRVYEELAARPDCELQWLITLAAAYLVRRKWGKLKLLAERLEKHPTP